MNDWTKRLALAGLLGFVVFFFSLPISCCGFVLYNEHLYGSVGAGGPAAILMAAGVSFVLSGVVMVVAWRKSRPR